LLNKSAISTKLKPVSGYQMIKQLIKSNHRGYLIKLLFKYYPFTILGTILLLFCVWLLTDGFLTQNPYDLILSITGFFILFALSAIGRIRVINYSYEQGIWDTGSPLYAEVDGQFQSVFLENFRAPLFYRIHFTVRGRMIVGNEACCYIFSESSSTGGEILRIPLNFSFAGRARVKGILSLRDIFGLTRTRFGAVFKRTFIVQPAPFSLPEKFSLKALGGQEEKSTRKSSEEERYYMREYIPGDRFRDINWKSSSRLSQLITKISPHSQEKTKLINVELRHFWLPRRESRDSVAHLNFLKSLLISFLKKVKSENQGYNFIIKTQRGNFILETEQDIDRFSLKLATIFFELENTGNRIFPDIVAGATKSFDANNLSSHKNLKGYVPPVLFSGQTGEEVYIFSTPFDSNLPLVMEYYRNSEVHLFITADGGEKSGFYTATIDRGKRDSVREEDYETSPGVSSIRYSINKNSLNRKTNHVKTFYTIKSISSYPIPGFWALRRERIIKKSLLNQSNRGNSLEFPLKTKLFLGT